MNERFPLHVRTTTGLEELLAEELHALGATEIFERRRLVTCEGDLKLLYRANLWLRTAIRVLRPLSNFAAPDEKTFYDGVRQIDWSRWLRAGGTLAVDAHVYSSFTTHSLYLSQLTKDAIVDQIREKTGQRPSVDLNNPDLRIAVSLYRNTAEIHLDSSGESLHKRGYRRRAGAAPLNEALAAGILKVSGWDGTTPLIDPMTGSGTFAIEAAMIQRNIAPGLLRPVHGFQRWPDFDRELFRSVVEEAKAGAKAAPTDAPLIAFDIDPTAIVTAKESASEAGLSDIIRFEVADFFSWKDLPEGKGLVVMNPPYDERLKLDDVEAYWSNIGKRLKEGYSGWTASVLCGNIDAMNAIGLRTKRKTPLYNGAIECRLLQYELLEGSLFRERLERPLDPASLSRVEIFTNRLKKSMRHLSKQAKRQGLAGFRLYDWDIPELPFIVEKKEDVLEFVEIPRNRTLPARDHERYVNLLIKGAAEVAGVAAEKVIYSKRGEAPRRS